MRIRNPRGKRKTSCSKCDKEIEPNRLDVSRYCKECQAAKAREGRKTHSEMSEEERKRENARAYVNVYVGRGVIRKTSCVRCWTKDSHPYHEDLDKPLELFWLCKECNLKVRAKGIVLEKNLMAPVKKNKISNASWERLFKCLKCKEDIEKDRVGKQNHCNSCLEEYEDTGRKMHKDLDDLEKKKANARSYLHVYVKRGNIKKNPCVLCGSDDIEAHHEDYDKPLAIFWLCRPCHMKVHRESIVLDRSKMAIRVTMKKGVEIIVEQ